MSVARAAYFKKINQAQVDADQAAALLSLGSRMDAVESSKASLADIATKAEVSYVDAAVGAVDAKVALKLDATAADGFATASALLQKADVAYVEGQINSLAAVKADATAVQSLSSEVNTINNQVFSVQQQVQGKQDALQAQQRVAAENDFFSAIKASIHIDSAVEGVEYDYTPLGIIA